jgi:hypothetical protein
MDKLDKLLAVMVPREINEVPPPKGGERRLLSCPITTRKLYRNRYITHSDS